MTLVKKNNNKDPKFKFADIVKTSKYKNIFAKGYTPNWSEKVFMIKKVKNSELYTYITLHTLLHALLVILTGKKLLQ